MTSAVLDLGFKARVDSFACVLPGITDAKYMCSELEKRSNPKKARNLFANSFFIFYIPVVQKPNGLFQ